MIVKKFSPKSKFGIWLLLPIVWLISDFWKANLSCAGSLLDGDNFEMIGKDDSKDQTRSKGGNHEKLIGKYFQEDGSYDLSRQFRKYYPAKKKIAVFDHKTELFAGGSIKADYYGLRAARTLDKSNLDDQFNQVRLRTELSLRFAHKMDKFRERPVVEGQFSLGNTTFGRVNGRIQDTASSGTFGAYDKIFPPINVHFQQTWIKVHFDQIFSNNEPTKFNLQAGFFPFLVGRGVSLGDWFNGGAYGFGFAKSSFQQHAPKYPMGLLLTGSAFDNGIKCQLYYSPSVTEESYPDSSNNLAYNRVTESKDAASDRHIVAGRICATSNFYENSNTWIEPYFVYYNSPRHTALTSNDSLLRFLTIGIMADHKASGFEINFEAAKQFGRLRTKERLNLTRPDYNKFINTNHTFYSTHQANLKRPYPFATAQPGDVVVNAGGTVQPDGTNVSGCYYSLPTSLEGWMAESGLPVDQRYFEYHPSQEIELTGKMAMLDIRYTFDDYPLAVAGAFGYFSGDNYPFNDSVDEFYSGTENSDKPSSLLPLKTSKSFLPLRDFHYTGLWALPMVMFNAGIIPRPYNLSLGDKMAFNEQDCATDIIFLFGGFMISPTNNLKKFVINPNIGAYWASAEVPAWMPNSNAQPPLVKEEERINLESSGLLVEKEAAAIKDSDKAYKKMNGWNDPSKTASKYLGWEVNCMLSYQLSQNLELMIKAAVFVPGQRYVDLKEQPNQNTSITSKTVSPNGNYVESYFNKGLGNDIAYGLNCRIGYSF